MKIEEYELGQKVSLYGIIEEINIEDIYDKENTTTLSIKTVTGKIHVNPKWEEVKLDQPKPVVPQFAIDWVDDSREYDYEFDEWFEYNNQPREVYEWLNPENKRQADLNALALFTLIINGPDAVEVEKEKLYNVSVLGCTLFKMTSDNHVRYKMIGENETLSEPVLSLCKFEANLTEREIKQADERLWQFAKSAF
ncbi:DUF1642 domain-containing protein [Streptococcus uberis]|uniref:DUF1642 domain-containing protein n=1 Tax=Streptococcus uberis TaxID=1349 RepID=UPI0012B674B1|nr:DUF1642 domain-containing protein [Streptococcus uberis]MTB42132.1 DUF1642 domain-containing protein [Streptococcus uberis]